MEVVLYWKQRENWLMSQSTQHQYSTYVCELIMKLRWEMFRGQNNYQDNVIVITQSLIILQLRKCLLVNSCVVCRENKTYLQVFYTIVRVYVHWRMAHVALAG